MRGALGLAERVFQQVIQYVRETLGEHTFLLGMPFISYADLLREQNRLEEAVRYAEQGIAYCRVWQPIAGLDGQIHLARIDAARSAAFCLSASSRTPVEERVASPVLLALCRFGLAQRLHSPNPIRLRPAEFAFMVSRRA